MALVDAVNYDHNVLPFGRPDPDNDFYPHISAGRITDKVNTSSFFLNVRIGAAV